jgi:hypothetical protein
MRIIIVTITGAGRGDSGVNFCVASSVYKKENKEKGLKRKN